MRDGDQVTENQELVRLGGAAAAARASKASKVGSRGPVSLRAPAAGRITEATARAGALASPQLGPLFRIAIDNEIELDAEVPNVHVLKLTPGATARITIDGGPDLVGPRPHRLAADRPPHPARQGRGIALPHNPAIKVGMFARATIDANRSCGVAVPKPALDHSTVQVVKDNTSKRARSRSGCSPIPIIEIREGIGSGEIVVADAGTSLHDGDTDQDRSFARRTAGELADEASLMLHRWNQGKSASMALNISAWSIRQPLPSIVFSIILLILGWMSFTKLAVTRLPNADIPVISVAVVAVRRRARRSLNSQVTKTIEDGVSGVEGVRHILPRSPTACRSPRSSSRSKPTPTAR